MSQRITKILSAMVMAVGLLSTAAHAEDLEKFKGKYSPELLNGTQFTQIVRSESRVIENQDDFSESLDLLLTGVSSPATVEDGMLFVQACKPHACDSTYTIWGYDNNRTYASIVEDGNITVYGNPPADIRKRLLSPR